MIVELVSNSKLKIHAIEIQNSWEFVACFPLSITEFTLDLFIHKEGWQQNNPQNILYSGEICTWAYKKQKHEGYTNDFDALDILPNTKRIKNIRTNVVLVLGVYQYNWSTSVTLKLGLKTIFF